MRVSLQWRTCRIVALVVAALLDARGDVGGQGAPPGAVFEHRSSRSDTITAIYEGKDGLLWIGTLRGGAYRLSSDWRRTEVFRHGEGDRGTLPSDEIWGLTEDAQGNLWVAATGGLCRYVAPGFRCYGVHGPPGTNPAVLDLVAGPGDRMWAAHSRLGAIGFTPSTGQFGPLVVPPESAASHPASTLFFDRERNELWFGKDVLYRSRIGANGEPEPPQLVYRGSAISQLFRDRRGRLWMGGRTGLFRWDEASGGFVRTAVPELDTAVVSIVEDREGRLWVGTPAGLVGYSPDNGSARRYASSEGFAAGELNPRAALRRSDGTLLFGGTQGLVQFDPAVVTVVLDSAPVVVTQWRKMTSRGTVEGAPTESRILRLESSDRAFTLEFGASGIASSSSRRYRYRIPELSAEWMEAPSGIATLPTPRSGRYTFQVQTGALSASKWSNPVTALTIEVVSPFWKSSWFRAGLLLLLLLLGWTAHRRRLRQVLAREGLRVEPTTSPRPPVALPAAIASSEAQPPAPSEPQDMVSQLQAIATATLPGLGVGLHASPEDARRWDVWNGRGDLLMLYQEVLHDIAKYAGAREVEITLTAKDDSFDLLVADDGTGFTADGTYPGTGLKRMKEGAEALRGRIEFQIVPGRGTTTLVQIPGPALDRGPPDLSGTDPDALLER